ncbi:MAG: FliI/YscN family ATPase [Candidatus Omnitrophota bacterium]|jgi:flagellum-specific ATP synthase|nr:MAG: FliI/YscN family ATPase [Candidatus Omnitrophota bacterium]
MKLATHAIDWDAIRWSLNHTQLIRQRGYVDELVGVVILARGPGGAIGDLVFIYPSGDHESIPAEIVGFRSGRVILMAFGDVTGIRPGCEVVSSGGPLKVRCGEGLLGRILNGLGVPCDGKGPAKTSDLRSIYNKPPSAITRRRITQPLATGVKVIDTILTWGRGQRIGVFSGSGVGKSTLMGMIARSTEAEINVIALIGERGRELREFIEKDLGEEGLKRSVLVVATSDNPPLLRVKGALTAMTIAEYFRDMGKDVLFMMDSVTRMAMAQREVGLAAGEPPTTRGYTPSVFALLPSFLERAGTTPDEGTVTGLFTVLVEGDDMNEPIADATRGILDGHIVLSRQLAHKNHYPSVDVLQSISRVMVDIVPENQVTSARRLAEVTSIYRDAEDLINIGAYQKGTNLEIDLAIDMIPTINAFLKQGIREAVPYDDSVKQMMDIAQKCALRKAAPPAKAQGAAR